MNNNKTKLSINQSYPTFLIVWIGLWIFIDGCILLFYTSSSANDSNFWNSTLSRSFWFDLAGIITSFITGMALIFLSLEIGRSVKKRLIIRDPNNFLVLGMVFFYLRNVISIAKFIATLEPRWYLTSLVFTIVWVIPSIIISMFHYFFYKDSLDYNEQIHAKNHAENLN